MKRLLRIILSLNTLLFAALSPQAYKNMQKYAPESVYILVERVKTNKTSNNNEIEIKVSARILYVTHSKSGLKKGNSITIIYTTVIFKPRGWVGPSSIPVLREGERYDAYLKKDKNIFYPVARDKSFID